ncbi:MAG: hypothetical protein ACFFG0_36685 [Candidatus Thorarchaeota archaeon]
MNIEERLLPLLKIINASHSINNYEECMKYIDKLHNATIGIKEIDNSIEIRCTTCIHHSVCLILRIFADKNLSFYMDIFKLAWICKRYLKDPDTL